MSTPPRVTAVAFRDQLTAAAEDGLTGILEAYAQGERIGSVVLQGGRVAWAVCLYQPENLGSFLRRLGQITEEQMEAASAEYSTHGGRRKLGRILQEAGLVPPPVLRRCLLLHVRMALACMLRNDALLGAFWQETEATEAEDVSFELGELSPEMAILTDRTPAAGDAPALSRALEGFASVPGYRASAVVDAAGVSRALHAAPQRASVPATLMATLVTTIAEWCETAGHADLGDASVMLLEGSQGALVIHRARGEQALYVALLMDAGAPTGVALHKLRSCAEAISRCTVTEGSEE